MKKKTTPCGRAGDGASRLHEITEILMRNKVLSGVTPEKLRVITEELGPTYIKIGQIMSLHSDILPKEYCDELMKLNSDVTPMPFSDVVDVIEEAYGSSWNEIFSFLDPQPLGAASIAQVHRATLQNGDEVIVKVQRKDIYNTMARDIRLLHHAARLLPPVGGFKNLVDLNQVLEEMWRVAQEEMNFLKEADNIEEFTLCNRGINFIGFPRLYREYTTSQVLVQEYIDGYSISEKEALTDAGYDLPEIGAKLVDNYIKQVMEDGFFHADPHPGNIRVRDGKIIWIDMGMMGRLTHSDRRLLGEAIRGIANHDTMRVEKAVLALADFTRTPDRDRLYGDISDILAKYGDTDISDVDIASFVQDIMEAMKVNHIRMPHGLSMLARSLAHIEGVLADISPEINMVEIAKTRMMSEYIAHFNLKDELTRTGSHLYRVAQKTIAIPELLEQILKEYANGQSHVNMELRSSTRLAWLLRKLVQNIVIGMWVMALLISSSIICTTALKPRVFGMPFLGFAGYAIAIGIVLYLVTRHFITRPR